MPGSQSQPGMQVSRNPSMRGRFQEATTVAGQSLGQGDQFCAVSSSETRDTLR